jgi:hypothetical protein
VRVCVCDHCVCECASVYMRVCVYFDHETGPYLRRELAHWLALVLFDHVQPIDVEHFVWVDRHQNTASVRLQETQTMRYIKGFVNRAIIYTYLHVLIPCNTENQNTKIIKTFWKPQNDFINRALSTRPTFNELLWAEPMSDSA